jgi:dihydroorotate dehydrogenase
LSYRQKLVDRYRSWVYPLLSTVEPERSHHLALRALKFAGSVPVGLDWLAPPEDERLSVDCFGLHFRNPLGVAAGLDKNGEAIAGMLRLGFGAVEVGTVTPQPQPGNPPPRLWRFPEQGALINALGFPSQGAAMGRQRLVGQRFRGVLGINLGKNRNTPAEEADEDYVSVLETLWDLADYFTINVSSPNTPGLRDLQRRDALRSILRAVSEQNARSARLHDGKARPVLVKIAPDLTDDALDEVLHASIDGEADGLIVSNTSTDHSLLGIELDHLPGGLSGRPIRSLALGMVRKVYQRTQGALPIIGVGGIENAADVIDRMKAGAALVQIYSAFIYGGPALPGVIGRDLLAYVEREGLRSIGEIVGSEARAGGGKPE